MHHIAEWIVSLFRLAWSAARTHLKAIGVIAAIGILSGSVKWLADIRKSWHEGNLAREQLRLLRKQQADEARFPAVVKEMESVLDAYRKENRFSGYLILTEEFFLARMKEKDAALIRKGIEAIEEKRRKINEIFRTRA